MNIAVHTKELERDTIDGTSNYLACVLRQWIGHGKPFSQDRIVLYHGTKRFSKIFGLDITDVKNISEVQLFEGFMWTQNNFARALRKNRPDVLWMPLQNIPLFLPRSVKCVVTIHDLAFKHYPQTFTRKDRFLLNRHLARAVRRSDHLITVSQVTKDDLLQFFPDCPAEKISVIHHGVYAAEFAPYADRGSWINTQETHQLRSELGITKSYLISVGSIQPRKNLTALMDAFGLLRERGLDVQLVLVGADAWLSSRVHAHHCASQYRDDIIFTGSLSFAQMCRLVSGAEVSVYPSLYEGFGLPVLESQALDTPVVCARNSSLTEVGGEGVVFADMDTSLQGGEGVGNLAHAIESVLNDRDHGNDLRLKGCENLKQFSWEKCARETLEVLRD